MISWWQCRFGFRRRQPSLVNIWTSSESGLKPGPYKLFCARADVERDGAEGPGAKFHRLIADSAQERGEFGGAKEAGNGFWEVGIGGWLSGNKSANFRQHFAKIPAVKISPQTFGRFRKFQDGDGAAGLQHTLNLAQTGFVVGEVAKTEGGGHQVKRRAAERKMQS